MAELGRCLSNKVAREREIPISGAPAVSRHVGAGPQAAPGIGMGRDPLVHVRGFGMGWGRVWGSLSPPKPCPGTCPHQTETPMAPSLMGTCRVGGHLPLSVPCSAASWHTPGSWQPSQHRVRVLLSQSQDGDQWRFPGQPAR